MLRVKVLGSSGLVLVLVVGSGDDGEDCVVAVVCGGGEDGINGVNGVNGLTPERELKEVRRVVEVGVGANCAPVGDDGCGVNCGVVAIVGVFLPGVTSTAVVPTSSLGRWK